MMTVTETRRAIMAMPYMTCTRTDGEWRVAPTLDVLAALHPKRDRKWCKGKQERQAYYTTDNSDAHFTAAAIHGHTKLQLEKLA